ncbi:MAG: Ig-like domain-containing protein, partial [Gemmatimonadota bacterium]
MTGARQVLSPGDSSRFTAQAFDAQGLVIPTAVITWSSRTPAVATVDARGAVRGVAVGTTQIVATTEGVSGSADLSVSVTELCDCTRIIDSTSVELVQRNDSSGVFVFRVIGNQVPVIDSGSIIVGAENGGFLRRVHRVVRSGNNITVQTTQAYLEEAIRDGAFAATSFSEGESVPIEGASAKWGEWTVAYMAPNVRLARAKCCTLDDVSISLLEIGKDVKVTGEVSVKKGSISFEPRLQLSGQFSSFKLQRFRTALGGAVDLNIEEYEAKVAFEYETDKKLWTSVPKKKRRMARLVKPFAFSIGPVPVVGIINKEVNLEVSVGGSVSTGFKGKFRTGFSLSAGAEWVRGTGWTPIAGSSSWLDVSPPEWMGVEGEATVKLALVPEYSILFYGVGGPFINLEPYAQGVANAELSFHDGKPSGLDWELKAEVGLNTNIGAKLSIFGFVDLVEAGFEIPIIRPFTLIREFSKGSLTARTTVTGPDQPDSINIRLRPTFQDVWQMGPLGIITRSGPPPLGRDLAQSSQESAVVPNDSATFVQVRSGDDFKHRVALHGLAGNCAADTASFDVGIRSGTFLALSQHSPSSVAFKINCIPLGALQVRTVATGQDIVTRSQLTLARRDTVGSGKGSPPLTIGIAAGGAPPDTVIDELAPANAALGTLGLHDATLDPGRRNCAVEKPATHRSAVASGDTAFTEFRLTCVALGHVMLRTVTTDPDSAP